MIEPATTLRAGNLSAAAGTDPGRVRAENEDRLYVDVDRGIFLVVDGVGGHAAGEIAATIAVEVIVQRLERPTWSAEQRIREAIALANNAILRHAESFPEYAGMTCVLTLAVVTDQRVTIGHVGDSRLYKLTPRGIIKVTPDHSPVGEREDAHEISEVEAMHHPRRNEVFRDVGSAFHEPDAPDFIEIVEATFEPESALLICSDGLSDMLPSIEIERTVRQHAGDPATVAAALIEAANEAGGKDNVTVVYVEGARFAATPRLVPAPADRPAARSTTAATDELARASGHSLSHRVNGGMRAAIGSRVLWLAAGLLVGLCAGIALTFWPVMDPVIANRGRTLVVGASGPYTSIAAAVAAARARDVIQLEPGEYPESVSIKDGVALAARIPGSVTLVAPAGSTDWISLIASGGLGTRISGITIVGRPAAPIATGLRLSGHDLLVDDVSVEGTVGVGMDIVNDGTIVVRASRLTSVTGVPVRIGAGARPAIRNTVFVRGAGDERGVAIDVAADANPELTANLFVGFAEPLAPSPRRDALLRGNYTMRSSEHQPTRAERP